MAANPPAASTTCVHCAKLLRVGHVADNSQLQWVAECPSLGGLNEAILSKDTPVTIIVARVQRFRKNKKEFGCDCFKDLKKTFNDIFYMPPIWWSDWCRRSGGFFGCEDTFNDSDRLDGHNSWFRCDVKQTKPDLVSDVDKAGDKDYTWWKMNVFVRWDAATHRNLVVILDPILIVENELLVGDDGIISLLTARSLAKMRTANSPYFIPSLFLEAAVHWHNKAVVGTRDLVRQIEKDHERKEIHNPLSKRLHDGMRHVIHVSEMLDTQLIIASQMLQAHNLFVDDNLVPAERQQGIPGALNNEAVDVLNRKTASNIHTASVALHTLLNRAKANTLRLNNEDRLSSNHISVDIARAAQVDNSIMKTLGYLGTAFLPATFIAALFSMSFFATDNNGNWIYHWQMWYYFAITIPLTIGVLYWNRSAHPRMVEKRREKALAKRMAERDAEEQRQEKATAEAKAKARELTESDPRSPRFPFSRIRSNTLSNIGKAFTFNRSFTQRGSTAVSPTTLQPAHQLVNLAGRPSATTSSAGGRSGAASGLGITAPSDPGNVV